MIHRDKFAVKSSEKNGVEEVNLGFEFLKCKNRATILLLLILNLSHYFYLTSKTES